MPFLSQQERAFLEALGDLSHVNPFDRQRITLEKRVLGSDYQQESIDAWSRTLATERTERPNVQRLFERCERMLEQLRERLEEGSDCTVDEAILYDGLVTYTLYYRYLPKLTPTDRKDLQGSMHEPLSACWRSFRKERERLLHPLRGACLEALTDSAHLFACLHQVRRAFLHIFTFLIGDSKPATDLRAAVWQSIFTHDMRRYRRSLYRQMGNFATLVTGASGTGKELVARAVGLSQYHPIDPATGHLMQWQADQAAFIPLNLSALSPTLIESELFGHARGAFTGADRERAGWLERCPPCGAVFLDEIGELDPQLQVKLLRVLQERRYSRLGDRSERSFEGKLIAATNRDLAAEMQQGAFRHDLYYRLCSDTIRVPTLREHLDDRPQSLEVLLRFIAARSIGDPEEAGQTEASEVVALADQAQAWIEKELPVDYPWPGNVRELEQCVRNLLIRGEYRPVAELASGGEDRPAWIGAAARGELSADALLNHYCQQVYQQRGGYEPAARLLGLDRRTVKSRVHRVEEEG